MLSDNLEEADELLLFKLADPINAIVGDNKVPHVHFNPAASIVDKWAWEVLSCVNERSLVLVLRSKNEGCNFAKN